MATFQKFDSFEALKAASANPVLPLEERMKKQERISAVIKKLRVIPRESKPKHLQQQKSN